MKELLQERATGETIADALEPLLSSKSARVALQGELAVVVSALGEGGAHLRAAQAVLSAWEEEL